MTAIPYETRVKIKELHGQNYSTPEIAKKTGVSESTVRRTIAGTVGLTQGPDMVTKYVPDYRRTIKPLKVQSSFTYGGVEFTVDYEAKTIKIETLENVDIIYDKDNIEDLKGFGEALVGIACTFDTLIMREKDTGSSCFKH